MQIVILAAGKSNRFIPFGSFPHKSMVRLLDKTILEHMLLSVRTSGIDDIVIIVSKNSTIPMEIGNGENIGVKIKYVIQEEPLGMGHALLQAEKYLQNIFFLANAYHVEFGEYKKQMEEKQTLEEKVVLLAKKADAREHYGNLILENGKVVDIIEKPTNIPENALHVVGIYLLNKSFLKTLANTPLEHYHFEKALSDYAKDKSVEYLETSNETVTLKYGWDLLNLKDYLLANVNNFVAHTAIIAKNVVMEGKVHVGENVKIYEGACIKGPCFIGENASVGNNAVVRGGVIIGKGAVIGANMEIKNSILMEGATTHSGFIGDSVIGSGSRIAGGFCSANVRFDRKEIEVKVRGEKVNTHRKYLGFLCGEKVDMGIGVFTMPGVVIGTNVTVGPATTVNENIDDFSTYYTKFETVIKKKNE